MIFTYNCFFMLRYMGTCIVFSIHFVDFCKCVSRISEYLLSWISFPSTRLVEHVSVVDERVLLLHSLFECFIVYHFFFQNSLDNGIPPPPPPIGLFSQIQLSEAVEPQRIGF